MACIVAEGVAEGLIYFRAKGAGAKLRNLGERSHSIRRGREEEYLWYTNEPFHCILMPDCNAGSMQQAG